MKILLDIYHLPQFNFLKNTILNFAPDEIDIFCIDRGKLYPVIKHELPGYNVTCIGDYRHNKGMVSMIFRIILPRLLRLYRIIDKSKYSFILTANYQANFIGRLKRIPNMAFNDDPRSIIIPILRFSTDEVYLPPFGKRYHGVKVFNALKEWAYLSPTYFSADQSSLKEYDLQPRRYLFIREVSTKTSNYLSQQEGIILSIADKLPREWNVVLSLENKDNAALYPDHWIILREPVKDIHSLMYYSSAVISSGDSMAREGALLGVPSIYAGIRDMPANEILIRRGRLWKIPPSDVVTKINWINEHPDYINNQDAFRQELLEEWDDITQLILQKVKLKKNNS